MFERLSTLKDGEGATFKKGIEISYKSGWQVADHGKETKNIHEAALFIKEMNGNCGVWFSEGIYFIDHSFRVNTLKEALQIGREHNQISVYGWRRGNLRYC